MRFLYFFYILTLFLFIEHSNEIKKIETSTKISHILFFLDFLHLFQFYLENPILNRLDNPFLLPPFGIAFKDPRSLFSFLLFLFHSALRNGHSALCSFISVMVPLLAAQCTIADGLRVKESIFCLNLCIFNILFGIEFLL